MVPEVAEIVQADIALDGRDEVPALGAEKEGIDEGPIGEQAEEEQIRADEEQEEQPLRREPSADCSSGGRQCRYCCYSLRHCRRLLRVDTSVRSTNGRESALNHDRLPSALRSSVCHETEFGRAISNNGCRIVRDAAT